MEEIRNYVMGQLDLSRELPDEEIFQVIDEAICQRAKRQVLSISKRKELRKNVFYSLRRLDVLQELMEDPEITEIMVNGYGSIFYEKDGQIYHWDKTFFSKEKLEDVIQQIVGGSNRVVNEYSPIVDSRLSDGSRVNIVLEPIAIDGSCISIRKFSKEPITMEKLISYGSIDEEIAEFLKKLVEARYNLFISGGTGSGKTTFLNALSGFIPTKERVITIEDSAELQIQNIPNLVRLEARYDVLETGNEISIRKLMKTALRLRPDRIILGEIRGEEALDMLQAMNTGHDGSLSTGHANSCNDMMKRIETMVRMGMDLPVEAIRSQIASGIDLCIHLGRLRDGSRKVLDVVEIIEYRNHQIQILPLYHFCEIGEENGRIQGKWEKMNELQNVEKLRVAGLWKK